VFWSEPQLQCWLVSSQACRANIAESILGSVIAAKAAELKQATMHTRILSINGQATLLKLKHEIRESLGGVDDEDGILEEIDQLYLKHKKIQDAMSDD